MEVKAVAPEVKVELRVAVEAVAAVAAVVVVAAAVVAVPLEKELEEAVVRTRNPKLAQSQMLDLITSHREAKATQEEAMATTILL